MKKLVIYGIICGCLMLLLEMARYRFWMLDQSMEWYGGIIAVFFTLLGIWAGPRLFHSDKKTGNSIVPATPPADLPPPEEVLKELGISKRELEVLQLISAGYSNQEIADKLFVSLNTIKTHSSRLFEKLDVKRRTQAVQKAKELQLLP